ncbi:response regulator transcription factor [Azospirillum sp. ST 5-10]|uniref:response regulator transcription factor n=1 Tax=unclassified Azospirillum TaxID=2630922 RepID=UPI003F4A2343
MRPLVLIAEDEPTIMEPLAFLVERAGLAVASARDAARALQEIAGRRPAVVILDLMLPGGSGLEVLKAVKGDPASRDIPVLVLTACGRDSDRSQALALGADAYVTKPFSNRDLMALVCRLAGVAGTG